METTNHGLRRELKLRDLVLMQVILIFGLYWTGFAAKQGSSQIVLWLFAILLFYLPLAVVVMKLSRAMPVEGGAYQWVKEGISPFAGYMAGWCLTVFMISIFAVIGSNLANGFAYAGGPSGAWMATSKPFTLVLTALACLAAFVINVRGLQVAKWLSGAGSVLFIATFLVMLYLLVKACVTAMPAASSSFSLASPGFSVLTLNVFAKMAIGALSGFDSCAVFSEECRKPGSDVARSVLIAGPLIALMYILCTSATLAYIPPASIDLAANVPQVIQAGFGASGLGRALTVIVVCGFNFGYVAAMIVCIGMVSRLPMVAGWDGLLPGWWSELHPRFRTPAKAVGAVTASLMVLGGLSLLGSGNQEAVQVATSMGIASLCIMYMLLFSVILFGFRSRADRPGVGIRLGALAAFLVALVSMIFQIVPLGEVADTKLFAAKVTGALLATVGLGAFLYWRGARRLQLDAVVSLSQIETDSN